MAIFTCNSCKYKTSDVGDLVCHYRLHTSTMKAFPCPFDFCSMKYRLHQSLKAHVNSNHGNLRKIAAKSFDPQYYKDKIHLRCSMQICKKSCQSVTELVTHLKSHIEEGRQVNCPFVTCQKKYSKITSLRAHVSKYHRDWEYTSLKQDCLISITNEVPQQQCLENEMDTTISNFLKKKLSLDQDIVATYLCELNKLGAEKMEDIVMLTESHLSFMKVVHAKKLLLAAQETAPGPSQHVHTMPQCRQEIILDWNSYGEHVKKFLQEKRVPLKSERVLFVNTVVADILAQLESFPGRKIIERVSQQIVELYPDSFLKHERDGRMIGTGCGPLMVFLENRIYNEKHKNNNKRKSDDKENEPKGCYEDNFKLQLNDDEYEEQEAVKEELKECFKKSEMPLEVVSQKMNFTFKLQRKDINASSDVTDLFQMWPYLFSDVTILNEHFSCLTGLDTTVIPERMENNALGSRIVNFIMSGKGSEETKKLAKLIEEQTSIEVSIYPKTLGVIPLLVLTFKEPLDDLIRFYKDGASVTEIDDDKTLPGHPVMAVLSDSVFSKYTWYIVVDQKRVNGLPIVDILHCMSTMYMLYFVLNIQFPTTLGNFYQFFQMYLMRMNPNNPQHSKKKKVTIKSRVATFIANLQSYEW